MLIMAHEPIALISLPIGENSYRSKQMGLIAWTEEYSRLWIQAYAYIWKMYHFS
jgi:hypothetical protein